MAAALTESRASRAAVGFALEVPALLLAMQGGSGRVLGIAFAIGAVLAARFGGRGAPPGPLTALGLHVAGVAATLYVALMVLPGRPGFGALWTLGFLGFALPRFAQPLTARSRTGILASAMLALMGLGRATTRVEFGIATAACLAALVVALMTADRGAPALLRHRRGALLPLGAAFAFAGLVMVGLGVGLPAAEPAVSRALSPLFAQDQARSAFGDGDITLGHVREIVTSDTVVLRVHGPLDYLRGQVYADYYRGRWRRRPTPAEGRPRAGADGHLVVDAAHGGPPITIEAEPEAGMALFAPLGLRSVDGAPEGAWVDDYGIAHVPQPLRTEPRVFSVRTAEEPPPPLAPPGDHDLGLPMGGTERFGRLARQWTAGAEAPLEQVEALRRGLRRGFTYSLELDAVPDGEDPILFFLTTSRRGHCELFASAFVLLARSLGLPARLVSGFRVFEHNVPGGWYVVRQRDAHAWVEVWLDGAWRTVDPTPPGALEGERAGSLDGLGARWDQLKRWIRKGAERLANLTAVELLAILAAIAGLIGLLVLLRRRRERRAAVVGPPPAWPPLARLEARLQGRLPRPPHETLARYATRLRGAGHADAAGLVDEVAALLYGGQGDAAAVEAAIERWLAGGVRDPG
ncbi:MAG: transglutaminase domain-containing protein [Myxococcales bacterium]|nr:transglutaminase domain-containing protein [Myxococcales bacterium]